MIGVVMRKGDFASTAFLLACGAIPTVDDYRSCPSELVRRLVAQFAFGAAAEDKFRVSTTVLTDTLIVNRGVYDALVRLAIDRVSGFAASRPFANISSEMMYSLWLQRRKRMFLTSPRRRAS